MKTLPRLSLVIALAPLVCVAPVLAQNTTPGQPLPGLDDFSLPSSRPAARPSPTPEPTINPHPTDTPTPVRIAPPPVVPTPRSTQTPRAAATPLPRPSATAKVPAQPTLPAAAPTFAPAELPTVAPTSEAVPSPTPTAQATEVPVAAAPDSSVSWLWPAMLGALALLVIVGIALWMRQRPRRDGPMADRDADREIVVTELPAAAPTAPVISPEISAPVLPVPTDARAMLDLELVPKRAGTNLLSAAVEYLIVIRNTGEVPATGVRLDVRLLSAGQQQDALISALFAGPIDRPITAPFDLPPGSMVELGGMAMHPKPTLEVITAGSKVMFVPVLTVHVRYDWEGGSGQTGRSYVIGIDRGADAKLAPFRIDAGARMYDTVAALDYPVSANR